MRKQLFVFTMMAVTVMTACNENKQRDRGIDTANLDTIAVAGDDFYQFACGGWMVSHPLKPEYSRYGTFDELREKSQEQLKDLINEIFQKTNEQGSVAQKLGDLYSLAMDSIRLNTEGNTPLLPYLGKIDAIRDKSEITGVLAEMFRSGMYPFFGQYVYADDKNSSLNIYHLVQGGFQMGDRDYYLENNKRSQELRVKYVELIEKLFSFSGYDAKDVKKASAAVMKIETQLAKVASSREDLRDPIANYHKITVKELSERAPDIQWLAFFDSLGIKEIQELNLGQLNPIAEVSKIIKGYSLQDLKYYLSWNVINEASSFLDDAFSDASFDFYGKALSGKEVQQERWKRAVDMIDGSLGEAMGQLYVAKYFPPASKKKMLDLVGNLQKALNERIMNLSWMGDETKAKAQEKLNVFHVKVGYPDKWRDYSKLTIQKSDSYWENIVRSNRFDFDYMFGKFNKPVDKDEWLMTPQTVNAYYNPSTNEICFPAAILQPPFFNPNADDAVNYGAIGVVIGHEMTHGFDDQGRKYDKDGNLIDWWTTEDAKRFEERAKVLVDYFDNIVVLDTVHANGRLTLGENIADQGGLQVSWQAYQNTLKGKQASDMIDGYTRGQQFFLSYATVWAGNIRDAEILRLTKIDPHALGKWRVNGALPHIDAWYDAFGVTEDDALYVPKEKRVAIW
ncbi:MAG: M13 family metallopeptidase [Candidatus Azobacteroides sp.]|nr:M13 family metallopeptidase [Candidatus Azobacteroides sp.]